MEHKTSSLNGEFGILIEPVTCRDLGEPTFQRHAYDLWSRHGGLLALRGDDLKNLTPEELVAWSNVFGDVENEYVAARETKMVKGFPILRIGNLKNESGEPVAMLVNLPPLKSDADMRYNPETRRPLWHTDSTFLKHPPIGSVFHCKQAPPKGAETLFADTRTAFSKLSDEAKAQLESLEAVCSLAHHDKKVNLYSPSYPVLSPEQRAANPPTRVPIVLKHPVSGELALYGLNSSTCAIVPKGQDIAAEQMDSYDLEGIEDDSVHILRDLLPFMTGPEFTVKWGWQPGDVVVWDNRCTIHSATGFEYEQHTREMWRLTLLDKA